MSPVVALIVPLLLLSALVFARARRPVLAVAPLAPLLLLWPFMDGTRVEMASLLLGMQLGADTLTRPLLLLTALAWPLAGLHARSNGLGESARFWGGWLASLFGTSLLLLAGDLTSFYVGYAIVSLSAYLLVTYNDTAAARRAGRVYLVMALLGEACILAGVMMIAGQLGNVEWHELAGGALAESPARWLLFAGFAVKMGILPLHLWLPLAHPAAPVPASAILSGVIVKAGLLGWLRLVPGEPVDPAFVGQSLLALGLATAFGGALIGLTQARIKTVLAYSTISQMGLLLMAFSLTLIGTGPEASAPLALIGLMALHHGLCKSALFLACGCAPGRTAWRRLLFALPALSIAAAPLTAGYLVKGELKAAAGAVELGDTWLALFALTSTATTLVLWRAWRLSAELIEDRDAVPLAWMILTGLALVVPGLWAWHADLVYGLSAASLWSASWPLLLGAGLIFLARFLPARAAVRLPEGDLVVAIEALLAGSTRWYGNRRGLHDRRRHRGRSALADGLQEFEKNLRPMPAAGLMLLITGALLWLGAWL